MTTATKRRLIGQEVFSVGEHTDSSGYTKAYSEADLDSMVRAFNAHLLSAVPIRLGHTSDEFLAKVAENLNVPGVVLTGDSGEGQAALGQVVALSRDGGMLLADFELHDKVAEMYEQNLFGNFSSEILLDYQGYPCVLSGVAFLGAERPAVKGMKPGNLLTQQAPDKAHVYTMSNDDGVFKKLWSEFKKWRAGTKLEPQEGDMDLKKIAKAIKLAEGASEDAVLSQLEKLMAILEVMASAMGITIGEAPPDVAGVQAKAAELKAILASAQADKAKHSEYAERIARYEARIASLERSGKLAAYREQVNAFTAVVGKPEELTEQLLTIEEKIGKEGVERTLATWKQVQTYADQAGVLKRIGTSRDGAGKSAIEAEIEKWVTDNPGKTLADAYAHFSKNEPDKWHEYRAAVRQNGGAQ